MYRCVHDVQVCSGMVWFVIECRFLYRYKHSQEGLFYRINPLARGVAPAKVMSPQRHQHSWGYHFSWDCPFYGSQLNCHERSNTGTFSYSSASAPHRNHFIWGHPLNWGQSCIGSELNYHSWSATCVFSYSSASAVLATLAGATPFSL